MSKMSIKADFVCGTDIKDACKDAVILATKLGVNIKFDFNDIIVIARPNVCIQTLIKKYHKIQSDLTSIKVCII